MSRNNLETSISRTSKRKRKEIDFNAKLMRDAH